MFDRIKKFLGLDTQPDRVIIEDTTFDYRIGARPECIKPGEVKSDLSGVRAFLDRQDEATRTLTRPGIDSDINRGYVPRHTPKTRNRQPLIVDPEDDAALFASLRQF